MTKKQARILIICILLSIMSFIIGIISLIDYQNQKIQESLLQQEQLKQLQSLCESAISIIKSQNLIVSLNKNKVEKIVIKYYDVPLEQDLQDYIFKLCDKYNLDNSIVFGMMELESKFNSRLISETDDFGLMQINKCNHQWAYDNLNVTNILDPYQNALTGITIFGNLYEKYEDYTKALMAYNYGEYGAQSAWEKGQYTSEYVEVVKARSEKYKDVASK